MNFSRFKVFSFISILGAFFLSACTGAGIKLANAPSLFFDGQVKKEILYDTQTNQMLDIYVPTHMDEDTLPVVVFFYGGRWTEGQREDYQFVGMALAKHGFVVVLPDTRKYPQVKFPAFVEDGAKAVGWVHRNIGDYSGDPERIFLAGHSSGAHIASLLVSDERYLDKDVHASLKGFAGLAGPYDFTPKADDLKDIFGPPSRYPQMQVTTFIDGSEPPMLLLYGGKDESVARFNLERLQNKIENEGGRVQTKIYRDINHVEIVGALTWFWRYKAPVLEDMTEFFKSISSNNLKIKGK